MTPVECELVFQKIEEYKLSTELYIQDINHLVKKINAGSNREESTPELELMENEMEIDIDMDMEIDIEPEADSEADSEADPEAEPEPEIELDLEFDLESDLDFELYNFLVETFN